MTQADIAIIRGGEDVRLLWHSNFYDVPLSGALTWRGSRYWFRGTDIEGTYEVLDLSAEQWAFEDAMHEAFREYVGHHTDYVYDDDSGYPHRAGNVHPLDQWRQFYDDPRWADREDSEGPVVARWDWFDPR